MVETVCNNCGNTKSFNEDKLGKKFKCPACGNIVLIEKPAVEEPIKHSEVFQNPLEATQTSETARNNNFEGKEKIIKSIYADEQFPQQTSVNSKSKSSKRNLIILGLILFVIVVSSLAINKYLESKTTAANNNTTHSVSRKMAGTQIKEVSVLSNTDNTTINSESSQILLKTINIVKSYFTSLQNKTFDASNYFAPSVVRFFTMYNTTPSLINNEVNTNFYKEFVNPQSTIDESSVKIISKSNDELIIDFISSSVFYRNSKHKTQHVKTQVKTVFDNQFKIKYYNEYKILENTYDETTAATSTSQFNEKGKFIGSIPCYIINVAAIADENVAINKVTELKGAGYNAGYLWIPDYKSLSGTNLFSVFIGPTKNQEECERATEEYRKKQPDAYGLLLSQENIRVEIKGVGKVSGTENNNSSNSSVSTTNKTANYVSYNYEGNGLYEYVKCTFDSNNKPEKIIYSTSKGRNIVLTIVSSGSNTAKVKFPNSKEILFLSFGGKQMTCVDSENKEQYFSQQ